MLFNSKKTCCMVISIKARFDKRIPDIFLNGGKLTWTKEYNYLGVRICSNFSDDKDILRQRKSIYAKGNTLIRKFRNCSEDVKDSLFQSYCSNFYCCTLWYSYSKSSFKSLKVAYDNVYRYIHNIRPTSMSVHYVSKNIDCLCWFARPVPVYNIVA